MLTKNKTGDITITAITSPKRAPVTFLIDTGAQISALTKKDAQRCGIVPTKNRYCVLSALGTTESMNVALVKLPLPGEENQLSIDGVIGDIPTNLLGMNALARRQWEDSEGLLCSFGTPHFNIRLLQAAASLPFSKVTNVKQYLLPLGAKEGTKPVIQELRQQGVTLNTRSPFNSPVWPVRNPNGKWRLTIDFRRLNANTDPLTAAVPNLAELITLIQEKAHSIMPPIDVKDMFFMTPLQPEDMDRFAFAWEGQQHTFTRLPQGYKHSPTLAHHALAQEFEKVPKADNLAVHQHTDDTLVGGDEIEEVRDTQQKITSHLESLDLQIPSEKTQNPSHEVKLLGIWGKGGMTRIPPDTLTSLDQIKMPESKKDLQRALGLLVFRRKHIPDFP